jgi:hypothetical protein
MDRDIGLFLQPIDVPTHRAPLRELAPNGGLHLIERALTGLLDGRQLRDDELRNVRTL